MNIKSYFLLLSCMANSSIIYMYLSFKFQVFLKWFKMSSWQNNNDNLLCTRYWAIPEIMQRVGIYGGQGHGKIILN